MPLLLSVIQSWYYLVHALMVAYSKGRQIRFENKTPVLPILFYRKRTLPTVPHVLQLETEVKALPVIQLGQTFVLEFPDRQQFECFAAGIVNATPRFCCLALIVLVEFHLELMYLGIQRSFLHKGDFESLVDREDNQPHWLFLQSFDILNLSKLLCHRAENPQWISEVLFQKWGPLINEHQELILGPNDIAYAEVPSAFVLVSVVRKFS